MFHNRPHQTSYFSGSDGGGGDDTSENVISYSKTAIFLFTLGQENMVYNTEQQPLIPAPPFSVGVNRG